MGRRVRTLAIFTDFVFQRAAAVRYIPNRFLCLGVPGSERPLGVAEPEAPAGPAEPIGVIPRDWWATGPPPGVATREPGVTIAWRAPEPGREPPPASTPVSEACSASSSRLSCSLYSAISCSIRSLWTFSFCRTGAREEGEHRKGGKQRATSQGRGRGR